MTSPLQPFALSVRLAPTPKNPPKYSVRAQLMDGETISVADPNSTRAMVALMDMCALHGGAASHYGGPAAFAELMSATHALMYHRSQKNGQQWYEAFHFVNDGGHCENGLYALKANYGFADLNLNSLKKFRSVESSLTGHGEAHLFPQGVLVSNGPLGSGLPQAQGLAMADALTGKKRTTICAITDGAAMEGEAKEAFAAIPGFAAKGKMAPFICILSDNKTKLSGRIEQDSYNMGLTFASFEKLGWKVIRLVDGHNLHACMATIEEALVQVSHDPNVPVLIHANTVKGKGSKKAESSATGAHGFPLKKANELPAFLSEIYDGKSVPQEFSSWATELEEEEKKKAASVANTTTPAAKVPSIKIQVGIAAAMINQRRAGMPIISVTSDLPGSTGVAEFNKEFPGSTIDVGVAEANMISTAVGLSLEGFIPVVDTFAQFGVTKGALPLIMANLSLGPVIGVFSHTGFQDAADGASHQALSFIAQVAAIPHVDVYTLSCSSEAEALMTQTIQKFASDRKSGKTPRTTIFFLGRENFPTFFGSEMANYQLGKAQIIFDNSAQFSQSVVVAAAGSMVGEAFKAAAVLAEKGRGTIVIHPSAINNPDTATFAQALKKTQGRLVTVEEHRLVCGFGAILTHALNLAGESLKLRSLAIGDHFGQSAYEAIQLYRKHGLDADSIVKAALEL